ncbi:hypothetical protein TrCOL_g13288 [Triparma columacea]|uniref:Uncharacterized protein n=1 Tax=Triparma columacea TaxID=722753 RepID=A0A9W7FV95_9STRA|nr:hypothetical protein TrCOL_g13288 [Triparma columacea]
MSEEGWGIWASVPQSSRGGGLEAETKDGKSLSNFITPEIRDAIIHRDVRAMRIAYLESTKNFISSAENFVPDKDTAKKLLTDQGKGEMQPCKQHMKMLAADLMTTKEVKRPMFCHFTGHYGGKDWFTIIQKAIKEDMIKKKKKKDKVLVFKPAKTIDLLIEKQAKERFERGHNKRVEAARRQRLEEKAGGRKRAPKAARPGCPTGP